MNQTVLLTGATGFVGRHLHPALVAAGWQVRCGSRRPVEARQRHPEREWVEADVHRPHTLLHALDGCRAAYYLVHGISGDAGYGEREVAAAREFRSAAESRGVERVVYLGGVAPAGDPSRHLAARLATGEALRGGSLSAVELRAALVIGAGGASWRIVRDLVKRLPVMVLPRWLQNRSQPVSVEDVAIALLAALDLPPGTRAWYDLPGPEAITHRELLRRTAAALGYRPAILDVPVLTPRLSSYWIGLVSDTDFSLAQELVEGLRTDLLPTGEVIWSHVPEHQPMPLDEAIRRALADDRVPDPPSAATAERIAEAARRYLERRGTGAQGTEAEDPAADPTRGE